MRGEAIYYLYLEVKGQVRLFLQVWNWKGQGENRSKKSENEQKKNGFNLSMDVLQLSLFSL